MDNKKLMDRVIQQYKVWDDQAIAILKQKHTGDLKFFDGPGPSNWNFVCTKEQHAAHIESLFVNAPDDATGYVFNTSKVVPLWLKAGFFRYTNSKNGWISGDTRYDEIIPRPVKPVPVEEPKAGWVPKVGEECEISNCGNTFTWCKPKFIGDKIIVVDHLHGEQHYHLGSFRFRKIKPERVKFISKSWALVALPHANYDAYAWIFGKQYDDGARFMDDE